jgi:molybdopterin molybdotransferase
MPEFFNVLAPSDALEVLKQRLSLTIRQEPLNTAEALDRVLAEDIYSPEDLPAFPRSAMDGFAVRAQDTFGASEGLPAYLDMVGEVPMGPAQQVRISLGQAAGVHTGGMLAQGADAVVMVENTQRVDEATIEVVRPVAPGENVIQVGEDVRTGELILERGRLLRPQDLGGLLALGITRIKAAPRPKVAIVSTGDELVEPGQKPGLGQIRDINTYTISALVARAGGIPLPLGIVPDDYEAQREAARRALDQGDILLFSAGSSVSARDMTADVINSLGEPGVLVHGVSLRPGKPTILGVVEGKPAFGLPGNPVSAMIVFDLLVRPIVFLLGGYSHPTPPLPQTVNARLLRDIASASGREDYVQVRLVQGEGGLCADPVFGKSNLIYTLIRADGTVKVPLDRSGLYAGEEVAVLLH